VSDSQTKSNKKRSFTPSWEMTMTHWFSYLTNWLENKQEKARPREQPIPHSNVFNPEDLSIPFLLEVERCGCKHL
jgi:hypothetical protein